MTTMATAACVQATASSCQDAFYSSIASDGSAEVSSESSHHGSGGSSDSWRVPARTYRNLRRFQAKERQHQENQRLKQHIEFLTAALRDTSAELDKTHFAAAEYGAQTDISMSQDVQVLVLDGGPLQAITTGLFELAAWQCQRHTECLANVQQLIGSLPELDLSPPCGDCLFDFGADIAPGAVIDCESECAAARHLLAHFQDASAAFILLDHAARVQELHPIREGEDVAGHEDGAILAPQPDFSASTTTTTTYSGATASEQLPLYFFSGKTCLNTGAQDVNHGNVRSAASSSVQTLSDGDSDKAMHIDVANCDEHLESIRRLQCGLIALQETVSKVIRATSPDAFDDQDFWFRSRFMFADTWTRAELRIFAARAL